MHERKSKFEGKMKVDCTGLCRAWAGFIVTKFRISTWMWILAGIRSHIRERWAWGRRPNVFLGFGSGFGFLN